jgi:hypothetical protein
MSLVLLPCCGKRGMAPGGLVQKGEVGVLKIRKNIGDRVH